MTKRTTEKKDGDKRRKTKNDAGREGKTEEHQQSS